MSITHQWRRLVGAGIALGVAGAGLSLAPAAEAATGGGTIVYVKDYNVWITDGDGSFHKPVTSGGTAADPWQSPTESDNGVVVAHHGGLIYRMNQRGEVFNVIDPPALPDSYGNRLEGRDLTETAISPDGSKIAYTYYKFSFGEPRWVTAITAATRLSDFNQYGLAFFDNPSWVTNSRLALNHWFRNDTHLYDLNLVNHDIPWFNEEDYTSNRKELSDLEVSRDGQWTAATRGEAGDQSLVIIRNGGDVQTSASPWKPVYAVTEPCELGRDIKTLREPTFAPDSSTVAWTQSDGVYRATDLNCDEATDSVLVAAGGSDPAWSVAAIGQTPDVPVAPKHLTLKKKPRVVGKAKVGKVLKVQRGTWSPAPKSFQTRWLRDGKPIAKATKAKYRVTRKDRGHRISVRVSVRRSGWLTTTKVTTPVRVKR